MLDARLGGKRALITGGSTGIGLAIAQSLADEGVALAIASRSPDPTAIDALRERGVQVHPIAADVSRESAVVNMVEEAASALGGLDLYVNVAAGAWHEPISRLTSESWYRTIDTNIGACVWGCREVARRFIRQGHGSILVIGSVAMSMPQPCETAYRISKVALKAHVETEAVELAPFGVRANLLVPGAFDTKMLADTPRALRNRVMSEIPLRREAQPREIAASAVLLLSDELSPYTTGATLVVDGGLSLRPLLAGSDSDLNSLNSPPWQ